MGLSIEQQKALALSRSRQAQKNNLAESGEYQGKYNNSLGNRFKNSLGNTGSLLTMGAGVLTDLGMMAGGSPPAYSLSEIGSEGSRVKSEIDQKVGATPLPRNDGSFFSEVDDVVLNIMTDPTSFLGPAKAGVTGLLKGGAKALGYNVAAAPGIVTGEDAGNMLEKLVTGDSDTSGVGAMAGRVIAGGVGSGLTVKGGAATLNFGAKKAVQAWKGKGKTKDEMVEAYSNASVTNFLEKVANAEGLDDISQISGLIEDFSKIHKDIVGTDAPLLMALSENSEVTAQQFRAMQDDPVHRTNFTNRIRKEMDLVTSKIKEQSKELFGGVGLEGLPKDPKIAKLVLDYQATYKKEMGYIDETVDKLREKFNVSPDKAKIGEAIETLINAKELKARKAFKPAYKQIIQDAAKAGATLPAESVQGIYTFIKQNKLQDVFGKGTAMDNTIMKIISPTKKTTIVPGLDETMPSMSRTRPVFKDLSMKDVDSLKRNINRLKRSKLSAEQRLKVTQLDEFVSKARETIPGDFNQRLKDTDLKFYQEVGVPFGEQGILDISAKKYAEDVAPVLMKNGSAMADFLGAAGKDGVEVARNTVLSNLYYTIPEITPAKINAYIKKNADVIDQIPGLKDDLMGSSVDMEALAGTRKEILAKSNALDTEIANNFLLDSGDLGPHFGEVAKKILKSRPHLKKVMKDLDNLDPASRASVRSILNQAVVDQILTSPEGGINYLLNPENLKSVTAILGADYIESVTRFATLSDAVSRVHPDRFLLKAPEDVSDAASRFFGGSTTTANLFSQYRNRVTSDVQKVMAIGSRVVQDRIKKKSSAAIAEILLDKDALLRFKRNTNGLDIKNPIDLQKIAQELSVLIPMRTLNSIKATAPASRELAKEEEDQRRVQPASGFQ